MSRYDKSILHNPCSQNINTTTSIRDSTLVPLIKSMEPSPKHPNYENSAPPPNYTDSDADVLLGSLLPPPTSCQRLDLPICLPQTVSGYDAPFARAYNPVLSASGIEQIDWLKFLDGLNIAIVRLSCLRAHCEPRADIVSPDCKPATPRS
jgi:hypothetical protein